MQEHPQYNPEAIEAKWQKKCMQPCAAGDLPENIRRNRNTECVRTTLYIF